MNDHDSSAVAPGFRISGLVRWMLRPTGGGVEKNEKSNYRP